MAQVNMQKKEKFVIQRHNTPDETHWDLMLEQRDTLQTYRLELPPEKLPQQKSKVNLFSPCDFIAASATLTSTHSGLFYLCIPIYHWFQHVPGH